MSDLDKLYIWDGALMKGKDIVREIRKGSGDRYTRFTDEQILRDFSEVLRVLEAPRNKSQTFPWCVPDE